MSKSSKGSPMNGQQPAESLTIRYFDIAWLSHCDGPGHRVVLFLQGCHLRCPWCHSPHSHASEAPLLFFPARCLRCGRCEQVCPQSVHRINAEGHDLRRENCIRCGKCVDACPISNRGRTSGALALPTKKITIAALWDLLYPQIDMLRSIGGITVSGGEALLQLQALMQLLRLCKDAGIHTAVETSGTLPTQYLAEVVELVDCWLFGLRPTPFYVPPNTDLIEDNLAFLAKAGSRVIVRMPVIAGITDLPESLERIALDMQANQLTEIQLLPFHRGTAHYYDAAGIPCPVGCEAIPSAERLGTVKDYFQRSGLLATIIH